MNTRRQFLIRAPLGLAAAAAACRGETESAATQSPTTQPATPGAPVAFNTAPPVGPEVTTTTFAEAEKLAQVTMTDAERATAVGSWRRAIAPMLERRNGPRKVALSQAGRADAEIAAGRYRGALHGVPFGVKDLLDAAGIPTTYGAEPFRNHTPGNSRPGCFGTIPSGCSFGSTLVR